MISIIVPVYNTEEYLEKCVHSIVNQSYTDFELILIDDGSTDRCGEICDLIALQDNRITVVHKENGGVATARNLGLDIAKGEYVTFIDSDDYVHSDFLKILYYSITKENADLAMAYVETVDCFDKKEALIDFDNYVVKNQEEYWQMRYFEHRTCVQHFMCTAKLYRRDCIKDIRFPDGKRQEDLFWFGYYIRRVNKVVVYPYSLYFYYQRESSNMHQPSYINFRDTLEADYALSELCENLFPSYSQQEEKVFLSRYFHHLSILQKLSNHDAKKLKHYFRERYYLDIKYLKNVLTKGQKFILFFLDFESVKFVIKMMDYQYDIVKYIKAHF